MDDDYHFDYEFPRYDRTQLYTSPSSDGEPCLGLLDLQIHAQLISAINGHRNIFTVIGKINTEIARFRGFAHRGLNYPPPFLYWSASQRKYFPVSQVNGYNPATKTLDFTVGTLQRSLHIDNICPVNFLWDSFQMDKFNTDHITLQYDFNPNS